MRNLAFTCLALLAQPAAAQVAQAPTLSQPLIDSAYAVIVTQLGPDLAARSVAFTPEFTSLHHADSSCAFSRGAYCGWPWRYTYYNVFFRFRPSTDSTIEGLIVVPLDTLGRLLPGYKPSGLPDCVTRPYYCDLISEERARAIARASGFRKGRQPWRARLVWGRNEGIGTCITCNPDGWYNEDSYVWEIINVLTDGPLVTGQTLTIHAARAVVLDTLTWSSHN